MLCLFPSFPGLETEAGQGLGWARLGAEGLCPGIKGWQRLRVAMFLTLLPRGGWDPSSHVPPPLPSDGPLRTGHPHTHLTPSLAPSLPWLDPTLTSLMEFPS